MGKDLFESIRQPVNFNLDLFEPISESVSINGSVKVMEFADGYVEILGNRIDGVESFEKFIEYLKTIVMIQEENKKLKAEVKSLISEKEDLIDYLTTKVEESKLERVYDTELKTTYIGVRETIYNEILDRI